MFDSKNFQGIQMLGIINALKTGDPTMDTLIAMFLPFLITKLVSHFAHHRQDEWFSTIVKFFSKRSYSRTISYTSSNHSNQGDASKFDDESNNCFLVKAIQLYMHQHCEVDLDDADLDLTDMESMAVKDDDDAVQTVMTKRGVYNINTTSTAKMLERCKIIKKPVQSRWHQVGSFDGHLVHIWVKKTKSDSSNNDQKAQGNGNVANDSPSLSVEVRLKSGGSTSIDRFVEDAYSWFMSELKKLENNDRFFFDLKGFEGRGLIKSPTFGKFKLGDGKTFDSLFSQQCRSLLTIVDQFESKSGKYAVAGYPHKLGLLLHGLPGTGKTSLIKALAHYTRRHIVSVPISRIATNQDLTTLFFNTKYTVPGSPKASQLGPHQVIFVLEDVDATSKVVMRRDSPLREDSFRLPTTGNAAVDLPPIATATSFPSRIAPAVANKVGTTSIEEDKDELNLTGLLNALDGVVETPGRIVIMTTNHPEMLDPALIRPGRMDKQLELGFMVAADVVAMIEHYYQTKLSDRDKERMIFLVNGDEEGESLELIPAQVEQLAMEKDSVGDMMNWLECKSLEKRQACSIRTSCSSTDLETEGSGCGPDPSESDRQ
jgi:chaperone BCS1